MACRDMEKCEEAREEIMLHSYNKNVHCKHLDLASMQNIRQFCDDINKSMCKLGFFGC